MEQDFYDQSALSEFDSTVEQFAAQLRECVRYKWIQEMAHLREENAKYADIKARWAEIELERQQERAEVERIKKDSALQARFVRAAELFKDVCSAIYVPTAHYLPVPQCGKCDSNRYIHHKSPVTGEDMKELCPYCGKDRITYKPKKIPAYEAKMANYNGGQNSLVVWYKAKDSSDTYLYAADKFADDQPFEAVSIYTALFKSGECCQMYCDYLNKRVENGEDVSRW